ncbi:(2Fe-2S) ferredoxin [Chlorella sorokiniana]|uniref:(2Fe-2S) ferredoxin n=1 Tax=Chlorella sorokiniana TaxID=3076 RepID=A0A2P6TIJ0_CHLSO|nr:(2Fe-2S) ferredoxin [Chlorella sorokiniana]|eukprot:PRW39061.1 (2Fe-2S) ferredoxin [Chlorella sorokiniana]
MSVCIARSAAFLPAAQAAAAQRHARRQRLAVAVSASGGFGSSKKPAGGSGSKKQPKLARYLETDAPTTAAGSAADDGWVEMPGVDAESSFLSKPIKAIILPTGRAVCLYKVNDTIYASDANSTAYKYPLADASLLSVKGKPAVEVALDGTVYDLATGKVLSWCPKNTLARKVLGGLKDRAEPVDLPVYPVQVQGSKVFVKFI